MSTPDGALRRILDQRPELVVVDGINPPASDLSFLSEIPREVLPPVVVVGSPPFVNGSTQAERIISTNEKDLIDAFLRVREMVDRTRRESRLEQLIRSLEEQIGGAAPPTRLLVRRGKSRVLLDLQEVLWIQSDGNDAIFHTDSGTYGLRETMTSLERRLPKPLYRIHRSTIVNATQVREVEAGRSGALTIVLRDGTRLAASSSYRDVVETMLEESVGAES